MQDNAIHFKKKTGSKQNDFCNEMKFFDGKFDSTLCQVTFINYHFYTISKHSYHGMQFQTKLGSLQLLGLLLTCHEYKYSQILLITYHAVPSITTHCCNYSYRNCVRSAKPILFYRPRPSHVAYIY